MIPAVALTVPTCEVGPSSSLFPAECWVWLLQCSVYTKQRARHKRSISHRGNRSRAITTDTATARDPGIRALASVAGYGHHCCDLLELLFS